MKRIIRWLKTVNISAFHPVKPPVWTDGDKPAPNPQKAYVRFTKGEETVVHVRGSKMHIKGLGALPGPKEGIDFEFLDSN
jgi:hypothetical protein